MTKRTHESVSPPGRDRRSHERRITVLERDVSELKRGQDGQDAKLDDIREAIGSAPDLSTGEEGSGMRGQLDRVVRALEAQRERREKLAQTAKVTAATVAAVGALVGLVSAIAGLVR